MPHPARSPQRQYSESTTWWKCPKCPKLCKSKGGRTRHIRQLHGNVGFVQSDGPRLGAESTSSDQEDMSLPRSNSHGSRLGEGSDMDMPEPIRPDIAVPNHTSPHSESILGNFMPIDYHSALPSSPLSNPISDSNRGSQPPLSSTTYHPVMNGE